MLNSTRDFIIAIGGIVEMLVVLVVAIALLVFLWGLAKFIFRIGGDEKAVEEGKRIMIWGLLALFVMVSVWGIIGFMQRELELPETINPPLPTGRSELGEPA